MVFFKFSNKKLVKERVDFSYLKAQCAVGFCGGKAGTSVKCHQKKRLVVTAALLLQRTPSRVLCQDIFQRGQAGMFCKTKR